MMPMGGVEAPPMESDLGMGNDMPSDSDENMPNENLPSDFDTNFDAGVEADEETDPKKYIQQLTGKLSQTLNSYNNENGEPDTELGKYVLGMLVKQGTRGMDDKDRKEIIKKINTNNSEIDNEDDLDNEDGLDDTIPEEPENTDEVKVESKTFNFTKKQIFENFGIVSCVDDDSQTKKEIDTKIASDTKKNRRTKPFEAPKKFKE
jgi:hypothetical protein